MKETKDAIESKPTSFFTGLMSKSPVFYKLDVKSVATIEKTRKELNAFNNQLNKDLTFNELWLEFCKNKAIKRLGTIGRDIADKKTRDIYREELELVIASSGKQN